MGEVGYRLVKNICLPSYHACPLNQSVVVLPWGGERQSYATFFWYAIKFHESHRLRTAVAAHVYPSPNASTIPLGCLESQPSSATWPDCKPICEQSQTLFQWQHYDQCYFEALSVYLPQSKDKFQGGIWGTHYRLVTAPWATKVPLWCAV